MRLSPYKVTVEITVQSDCATNAVKWVTTSLDECGISDYSVKNTVKVDTPFDVYESAKAAFYVVSEGDGVNMPRAAQEYLDAAIKALHAKELDTHQLLSVWQDVKPYL